MNEGQGTVGATITPARESHSEQSANRDPISGAHGAHPVGAGLGAAGAGAAGAVIGAAAGGPVGAMLGAAAGAIAGGLAGKGVAESIHPTAEDEYWRRNYATQPYVEPSASYEEYQPAYRYGWEVRAANAHRTWDDVEPEMGRDWEGRRGRSRLSWEKARDAARDAWHRLERAIP